MGIIYNYITSDLTKLRYRVTWDRHYRDIALHTTYINKDHSELPSETLPKAEHKHESALLECPNIHDDNQGTTQ